MRLPWLAAAFLGLGLTSAAAISPPGPYGGSCSTLSRAFGPGQIWYGRVTGDSDVAFSGLRSRNRVLCFTNARACDDWIRREERWLFRLQFAGCARGYMPEHSDLKPTLR